VTGVLKATALSAAGEPLEGAVVILEAAKPELPLPPGATRARSGPDGAFELRLASGSYTLEVQKEGFAPRQATFEIRPGGVEVLEVRLAAREP
jgi:hypothetical protein